MVPQSQDCLTSPSGLPPQPPPGPERPSPRRESLKDVVTFGVPVGYRLATTGTAATVECTCGCGWTLAVATLSAMPADARAHLFQYHQDWHTKRQARPPSPGFQHAMTRIDL
jgi:hypothetical protein